MKKWLEHFFIDGLSGMALGLFSTLIIGTILAQIADLFGGTAGAYILAVANVAKSLTGAGIGAGVACKYKEDALVAVSAAVAGMVGAFPSTMMEAWVLGKPGEPLGAFVAAYVAVEAGHLVSGKTKLDIIVTPFVSIGFAMLLAVMLAFTSTTFVSSKADKIPTFKLTCFVMVCPASTFPNGICTSPCTCLVT